jgi:hypothetical protein
MKQIEQAQPTSDARLELTLEVQYFKPSGKFYTEGRLTMLIGVGTTGVPNMWEATDRLRELQAKGDLPGIKGKDWIIYVNHPMGYPCIIPIKEQRDIRAETELSVNRYPSDIGSYGDPP